MIGSGRPPSLDGMSDSIQRLRRAAVWCGRARASLTGKPAVWRLPAGTAYRIAYLTLLDKMMILSFVLLAITVMQSLVVARYQDDDMPRALRIDRASRWIFPMAYLGLLALVVTMAGA